MLGHCSSGGGMNAADDYFEHQADMGVIGRGATLEEAFASAARATFAMSADPAQVRELRHLAFDFDEPDVELALVCWLNLLLAHAADARLALSRFRIERSGTRWHGEAWEEPWRAGLARGVEVKGATLTALGVRQVDGGWEARCVVDL